MRTILILLTLAIAGCSRGEDVAPALRSEVERFVAQDQAPQTPALLAAWHPAGLGGGLVCGEIEAPAALGGNPAKLRLVYDPASDHGQVEMHQGWVSASVVSEALIAQNRAAFESLWTNCEG